MPGNAAALDTLAKALAASGDTRRAVEVQLRAVALAPHWHPFRLALAKLYVASGDRDKALGELDRLSATGTGFAGQAEVAELRQTLKK